MTINRMIQRATVAALFLGAQAALTPPAQATTVGNLLVSRGGIDGCGGCDFMLNATLPVGETITSWSFFSQSGNAQITPFLIDVTTDVITGLGTTRSNSGLGVQSFSFGLVAGSDVVDANTRFAWHDGPVGGGNGGVVEYNFNPDFATAAYWFTGATAVGTNLGSPAAADSGRYYSVQVTTSAAAGVPEPATVWLFAAATGLGGLLMRRKRS